VLICMWNVFAKIDIFENDKRTKLQTSIS